MTFTESDVADKDNVSGFFDKIEGKKVSDLIGIDLLRPVEVKVSECGSA